jgi:hypothetical protein
MIGSLSQPFEREPLQNIRVVVGFVRAIQLVQTFAVEVLIAWSDTEDTLGENGSLLMDFIGWMAGVRDATVDGVDQTKSLVRPLAPDGTDPAKEPTVHEYSDLVNPIL